MTDWREQHCILQRALYKLEGVPYEEPKPRWVYFAPHTEELRHCPFCERLLRNKAGISAHIQQTHPEADR